MNMHSQYQHLTNNFLSGFKAHDKIPIRCARCAKELLRRKGDVLSNIKHKRQTFCNSSCASLSQQERLGRFSSVVSCKQCGNECKKQTRDLLNNKHAFCSRSCAATFNNLLSVKPPILCNRCGNPVKHRSRKYCDGCKSWRSERVDNMTLGDVMYAKGPSSVEAKWSIVRGRARTLYKNEIEFGCENCGYSKHAEVCHIKGIPSFSLETLVKVVNDRDNILILCKRCHWEFDHNLLDDDAPVRVHLHKKR